MLQDMAMEHPAAGVVGNEFEIARCARLGTHELFQWAGQDIYVSGRVRKEFATAAPDAPVDFYKNSDHQLTTQAETDRDAFLARVLSLSP